MYKLCAFDLDGTLVNTLADIAGAVNYSLRQMGYPEHEEDDYRLMVGNGMPALCRLALPEEVRDDGQTPAKLMEIYRKRYFEHCCDKSQAYPGIPEMVRKLNNDGILCAVITNKPQPQSECVLKTLFREDDFFYLQGQSSRFARKPDPETLLDCIQTAGIAKEDTVYVGDSDVDVVFAHNAGIACIGVSWGFRGRAELEQAGAEYITDTAEELYSLVVRN